MVRVDITEVVDSDSHILKSCEGSYEQANNFLWTVDWFSHVLKQDATNVYAQ